VSLKTGVEIAFLDEESLKKFVMSAPGNWAIKLSLSRDILVTVTPQLGQGHHEVTDQALGAALPLQKTALIEPLHLKNAH